MGDGTKMLRFRTSWTKFLALILAYPPDNMADRMTWAYVRRFM